MKFTFKGEYDYEGQPKTTVVLETEANILSDVLMELEHFLRGCGYHFDGELVVEHSAECEDCKCQENQD